MTMGPQDDEDYYDANDDDNNDDDGGDDDEGDDDIAQFLCKVRTGNLHAQRERERERVTERERGRLTCRYSAASVKRMSD